MSVGGPEQPTARRTRAPRAAAHRAAVISRLRRTGAVARNGVLRRFWISQMLSEVGDWIGLLGIAALLYAETGLAVVASASLAAMYLPYLFAPWLVGVCARIPPRTLLIGADLIRGAIILMLLLPLPAPALLLLVFLASIPTSVYEATRAAAVPEYAPDEATRDDALVLFQSTQQVATMMGFLIGGAALAFAGFHAAIVLNAASFFLSGLMLIGVPYLAPLVESGHSAFGLVGSGLRALRGQVLLRRALLLSIVSASTIMAGEALVVVYGSEISFGGLAGPLAASSAAMAAILGLLLPRHLASKDLLRVAEITMVIGGFVAIVSFVMVPSMLSGFTGYLALGVVNAPGALTYVVAVREMGPAVRAPVFALAQVGLMGGQAVVAVLAGQVADSLTVGLSVALWQVPCVVLALAWFVISRTPKQAPAEQQLAPPALESPTPFPPPALSPWVDAPETPALPATH